MENCKIPERCIATTPIEDSDGKIYWLEEEDGDVFLKVARNIDEFPEKAWTILKIGREGIRRIGTLCTRMFETEEANGEIKDITNKPLILNESNQR